MKCNQTQVRESKVSPKCLILIRWVTPCAWFLGLISYITFYATRPRTNKEGSLVYCTCLCSDLWPLFRKVLIILEFRVHKSHALLPVRQLSGWLQNTNSTDHFPPVQFTNSFYDQIIHMISTSKGLWKGYLIVFPHYFGRFSYTWWYFLKYSGLVIIVMAWETQNRADQQKTTLFCFLL